MLRRLRDLFRRKRTGDFRPAPSLPALSAEDRRTVERFAELYYRQWALGRGTIDIGWLGYKTLKCPLDLWVYQEILTEQHIDWIIETGTRFGGSGYFLACICELLGRGQVISIDIGDPGPRDVDGTVRALPAHPRLSYIEGSSTSAQTLAVVKRKVRGAAGVMVILDSDHTRDHVLAELRAYAGLVSAGSYLIVEDTNLNGHPVFPDFGPGPWEAVEAFLAERQDFAVDEARERFLLTLNPRGFLRKSGHHAGT